MADRLPRLFGKYILLKSLARGGMGEIYLAATDQGGGLSKLCVIKKIIAEKTDRAKVNRFLDEAKVVLRLSHANLVPTFDAGDAAGELFIAMELVEGKDLREIWNRCVRTRTRIPLDVALQVVRETARALAYVHTHGDLRLVHRDVAPPNILLSYYGEVKLTDFGLARSAIKQEHTAPGVVFGRASYLAPEQARGEVADGRTDVYSLGIVLWELLTGQPYLQLAGLDPVTSLSVVRNPKTVPPSTQAPWIAPELDGIVLKALAADRSKRFQSADEMRRALSDVMTRVAPRADAERVAEFLKGLYQEVRIEEAAERHHFLEEVVPRWHGERPASRLTPTTEVVPDVAPGFSAQAAAAVAASMAPASGPSLEADAKQVPSRLSQRLDTVVAQVAEPASETLHASALRVRNVSGARRPAPGEASGAETKIWRRKPKPRPEPAADGPGDTFVGRIIDSRYRIRHRIGEGGMGTVYLAEHVEIGKTVAVKILRRQYSGDKQLVERFRREARAASRVGHPHIIEVNDFGTTEDGCAYFVMEHLEGIDLADLIAHEGQLEPTRVMRIAIQICRALGAAHTAGIIHRDLKPENVFLVAREGQTDFVKVLDFGIARSTSSETWRLTNPGMTMGTPEYMAPEQVLGRPADARTDVYALGALMYEMLIGGAPFRAATGDTMLDQKMRPLRPLREQRPDVPAALDGTVAAAMAPDVGNRPQTMAALEYELTKIVFGRARAVTELLGLRELTAPQGETPSLKGDAPTPGATSGVGAAAPAPSPAFAALGAVVVPARLGPDEMEAFLEADLSPRPQITGADEGVGTTGAVGATAGSAPPPRRSPLARSVVGTADAFGAVNELGHLAGGPGVRPGGPGMAAVPALEGGPATPDPGRDRSRRIAAIMVLVALVVSIAWFSRQGRSNLAAPELGKSRDVAPVVRAPSSGAAPGPSRFGSSSLARAPSPSRSQSASAGSPAAAPSHAPPAVARAPTRGPAATSAGEPPPPSSSSSPPLALAGRSGPEVVPTKPLDKARDALAAGNPDEAVGLLRTNPPSTDPAVKALLIDALVASGTKAMAGYHWGVVIRRAREAVALVEPGAPSRGAHALLADALFAFNEFENSIAEYQRALGEAPGDARLRRHLARARQQAQTRAAVAAARAGGGAPPLSGAGMAAPPSESPPVPLREATPE